MTDDNRQTNEDRRTQENRRTNEGRRTLEDRRGPKDRRDCPHAELNAQMFREGEERMTRIEEELRQNTEATQEVLEILRTAKGFFKVVGGIGNTVKWLAAVAAAVFAAWHAYKNDGSS